MQLIGNLRQSQAKSFKMYDLQRYFKEEMNIRIILLKFPMIMTNYQKLRCQSTYSNLCGCRSHKYQFFHDIISEFAEHKNKDWLMLSYKIQDLQKIHTTIPGFCTQHILKGWTKPKSQLQSIYEKVKDFKIAEQNIIAQTPSSIQECMPLTRQPSFEQVLDAKQTLTPSYSRNQSPKLLFKPQQFILKSKFKTNNALDKILTEARNQITTSQSPRSVQVSQHKKIKSHPAKVYTEHNRLLQRVILKTKLNQ